MVQHDDEALARLRASDPATGSHPDLHTLRGAIAAKAPASQGTEAVVTLHDELRGHRVTAPWVAAAAVVALGFGGGGYAIGAARSPDPAPGPLAGSPAAPGEAVSQEDGTMAGAAPGMVSAVPDEATATAGPARGMDTEAAAGGASGAAYDAGPVRLVAGEGLPAERGTAQVRAVVSEADPEAFLTQWAERLDLEGVRPAGEDDAGWFGGETLIEPDSMRVLSVSDTGGGPLTFSYEDQLAGPYCATMWADMPAEELTTMKEEWARAMGPDIPVPDPSRCQEPEGPVPSEEQAVAAAEDFLASTGLDLGGFEFSASQYQDPEAEMVQVEGWPEGRRNDQLMVNVSVGPNGVFSAYGTVGELVSLGDYPVISAVEAVERYGSREFSMDYGVSLAEDMVPVEEGGMTSMPAPEFTLPEPVPVEPGMKIPLLLKDKVVTSAELTTGTLWTQTGGTLEVPAWKLMTDDGMHYSVLAVADEAIDWQSWE